MASRRCHGYEGSEVSQRRLAHTEWQRVRTLSAVAPRMLGVTPGEEVETPPGEDEVGLQRVRVTSAGTTMSALAF